MHRHGHGTGGVILVQQCFLELVGGDAPIVERQIAVALQLIAEAPYHYAGMIAAAFYKFRDILLPQCCPFFSTSGKLSEPLVVKFIDHENAVAVANIEKILAIGIVGRTDVVEAEFFKHLHTLFYGARIGCRAERSEGVVVGYSF